MNETKTLDITVQRSMLSVRNIFVTSCYFLAFGLLGLGTVAGYHSDKRSDQYQLIHLGWNARHGGVPYIDHWENKPPGLTWLLAASLYAGQDTLLAPWVMTGLLGGLALGCFAVAASRVIPSEATALLVLVGSLLLSCRLYDGMCIHPDFFAAMVELIGLSLLIISWPVSSGLRRFAGMAMAGAFLAAAGVIKQTGAATAMIVLLTLLVVLIVSRKNRSAGIVPLSAFVLGLAAVGGTSWYVLVQQGAASEAYDAIFSFNRSLVSAEQPLAGLSMIRLNSSLAPAVIFLWLGLVALVAGLWQMPSRLSLQAFLPMLFVIAIVQTMLALKGPSGSMRYWHALWPSLLWLGAIGAGHVSEAVASASAHHRRTLGLVLVTVGWLLISPLVDHWMRGMAETLHSASAVPTERATLAAIGEKIATHVPADETIYVWHYDPGIYLYANRRCASRFTYPRSEEQMDEIVGMVGERPPAMLVLRHTNAPPFSSWCEEPCRDALAASMSSYRMVGSMAGYDLMLRKDLHDAAGPLPEVTDSP